MDKKPVQAGGIKPERCAFQCFFVETTDNVFGRSCKADLPAHRRFGPAFSNAGFCNVGLSNVDEGDRRMRRQSACGPVGRGRPVGRETTVQPKLRRRPSEFDTHLCQASIKSAQIGNPAFPFIQRFGVHQDHSLSQSYSVCQEYTGAMGTQGQREGLFLKSAPVSRFTTNNDGQVQQHSLAATRHAECHLICLSFRHLLHPGKFPDFASSCW